MILTKEWKIFANQEKIGNPPIDVISKAKIVNCRNCVEEQTTFIFDDLSWIEQKGEERQPKFPISIHAQTLTLCHTHTIILSYTLITNDEKSYSVPAHFLRPCIRVLPSFVWCRQQQGAILIFLPAYKSLAYYMALKQIGAHCTSTVMKEKWNTL